MMLSLPANFDPEERGERAERIFNEGFNCCQAVVLAFADILQESFGLSETVLASMGSGFGGGFGRMREVCGAVSGMTLMAGFIHPASDPSVKSDRAANYALVQKFAAAYREDNGSIVCRELLGISGSGHRESPVPSDRTPEYYRKRPCGKLVRFAAVTVARELLSAE